MHSHAGRFVHRFLAPGRVSTSPTHLPAHLPFGANRRGCDRRFSSAQAEEKSPEKPICHYTETQSYQSAHIPDTLHFRQLVQEWRVHGDPDPFPRPKRAYKPLTAAQSRWAREHQKRTQAALNGEVVTHPKDLSHHQVALQEFCRSEPVYVDVLAPEDATMVSPHYHKPDSPYATLLRILRSPAGTPPTLTSLVKFHSEQPTGYRTARSYNLLLSLCLRHASFSTAEILIKQMKREGVTPTKDTKKLILRLWTLTGRWNWAWRMCRRDYGGSPLPLFLWMEFFQGLKRGAFRRFGYQSSRIQNFHVLREEEDILRRRFHLLMRNMPSLSEQERAEMPSRVVYLLVRTMLRFRWNEQALRLTREHLMHLPARHITPKELHLARKVIHLHILPTSCSKLRISDYVRRRDAVLRLLETHPLVTPSSTTLYLLLSLLRRIRNPYALSRTTAYQFQKRWGDHMVDRRVARRIASFAVKQGRIKAATRLIEREQTARKARVLFGLQREVAGSDTAPVSLKSPSFEEIFRQRGLENRKWGLLRRALRRYMVRKGIRVTPVHNLRATEN